MNKLKQNIWVQLFIIYTRYLIGGAFVFASIVKIQGLRFTAESGASNPIDTGWHFFETMYQSGLYWKFIGIGQLLAGFLLMTQRYSKLGALLNLPIIANVFVITISYYFAFTPVITGLILFANLLLIWWEWDELKIIFNLPYRLSSKTKFETDIFWQVQGLLLFSIIVLLRLVMNQNNFMFFMLTLQIVGCVGLIIGIRKALKSKRKKLSNTYEYSNTK